MLSSPAPNVNAVIDRYANGRSVRAIERAAGLREGAISWRTKPSTPQAQRVPPWEKVVEYAQAIGCPPMELWSAYVKDSGVPLTRVELADWEEEWLDLLSMMSPEMRHVLRETAHSLMADWDETATADDEVFRMVQEMPASDRRKLLVWLKSMVLSRDS